jgi:serine/tyrosine/threonine adenylyltransferase
VLNSFPVHYQAYWSRGMAAKLGLADAERQDAALFDELLALLHVQSVDFTSCFRRLSSYVLGNVTPARSLFAQPEAFDAWAERWRSRLARQAVAPKAIVRAMDAANPAYIPRNHKVEEALDAAAAGNLKSLRDLVEVLAQPFQERPGLEAFAAPAPPSFGPHRTFCGT